MPGFLCLTINTVLTYPLNVVFNVTQAATKTASTGDKTMNQKIALLAITIGLLLAGWMDGQDHQLAQKYAASTAGQVMACIHCGER